VLTTIGDLERGDAVDIEFRNMLTAAKLMAASAYAREESRGAHRRSDFPRALKSLQRRTLMKLEDADAIMREAADSPSGEVVRVAFG
jgi:L-aspartate oxidase